MKHIIFAFFCILSFTSATGQELGWAKQITGPSNNSGSFIRVDGSGALYVVGTFQDTIDVDPGPATLNIVGKLGSNFIIKMDAAGSFLWASHLNGPVLRGAATAPGSAGIYLAGTFSDKIDFDPGTAPEDTFYLTSSGNDMFIMKLDNAGNFVWAKSIKSNKGSLSSISIDNTGKIFITGHFEGTVDFDPGPGVANLTAATSNVFVAKLDASANFIWARQFEGFNSRGRSVAVDLSGNVYTTGRFLGTVDFDPGPGIEDFTSTSGNTFISKLDSTGSFVWARHLKGNTNIGENIFVDALQNVYTTGTYQLSLDLDPGPDTFNIPTVGTLYSCFINKLDPSGNFVWGKALLVAMSEYDLIHCATADNSGNLYISGNFAGTLDFDLGNAPEDTFFLSSGGHFEIFITKLGSDGIFKWAFNAAGDDQGPDAGHSLSVDNFGSVYATGVFTDSTDFDPGADTFILASNGSYDPFIWKITPAGTGIQKQSAAGNYLLYPNPTTGLINILTENYEQVTVSVRNISGQRLSSKTFIGDKSAQLNIDGPSGIYFVEIYPQGQAPTYF